MNSSSETIREYSFFRISSFDGFLLDVLSLLGGQVLSLILLAIWANTSSYLLATSPETTKLRTTSVSIAFKTSFISSSEQFCNLKAKIIGIYEDASSFCISIRRSFSSVKSKSLLSSGCSMAAHTLDRNRRFANNVLTSDCVFISVRNSLNKSFSRAKRFVLFQQQRINFVGSILSRLSIIVFQVSVALDKSLCATRKI